MPVALPIVCLLAVIIVMQWRQAVLDKAWHQGQVRVRLLLCSPSLPPGPTPASSCLPLLQGERNSMGLLLRERGMLASTNAALDEVMGTAQVRLAASPWVGLPAWWPAEPAMTPCGSALACPLTPPGCPRATC